MIVKSILIGICAFTLCACDSNSAQSNGVDASSPPSPTVTAPFPPAGSTTVDVTLESVAPWASGAPVLTSGPEAPPVSSVAAGSGGSTSSSKNTAGKGGSK